jgi:ABC-type protease/lipase transport system fused ATPase/permease subunit
LAGNVFLDGTPPQGPLWILDELTGRLPDGARTPLTADLRGGVDLDDNDWQRVALARALVRIERGARLLVVANAGAEAVRVAELARRAHPGLTVVLASREPAAGLAGIDAGPGSEPGR